MHTIIATEGRKHTLFIKRDAERSEVLQNIIKGLFSVSNREMRWNVHKIKSEALKEYEQK